jgi:hypothetical protein
MICSSVNRLGFMSIPFRGDGLYPFLAEIPGLTPRGILPNFAILVRELGRHGFVERNGPSTQATYLRAIAGREAIAACKVVDVFPALGEVLIFRQELRP